MFGRNEQGKLIVLDGTDGTGKTTQADLLTQKLKKEGYGVRMISFPQYNTKSAGPVEEYLSGKYGEAEEVDPYIASTFYAVDRFDAGFKIKRWLEAGYIVLSNRYVTANMGHQGNKLSSAAERKRFFNWLYNLEYKIFNIPKPDINIILHLRAELAQELAQKRTSADWEGKTNDIHQDNLEHLKKAERIFLEIAETFPEFHLIRCADNDKILAREEILELVWGKVKELL